MLNVQANWAADLSLLRNGSQSETMVRTENAGKLGKDFLKM